VAEGFVIADHGTQLGRDVLKLLHQLVSLQAVQVQSHNRTVAQRRWGGSIKSRAGGNIGDNQRYEDGDIRRGSH